jgi:hypothetical protein
MQLKQFWIDCIQLAEPLPGTLPQYLNQYLKEERSEFSERAKRLTQVNFVNIILEIYGSMLFSSNVQFKSKLHQDRVDAFVNSCNLQGDTLIDYLREMVVPCALLYGNVDVFADLPIPDTTVLTKADQDERGLTDPYIYMVPPINRVAWTLNDSRNYTYYQSQDVMNKQVQSSYDLDDKTQTTVWTTDTIYFYDEENGKVVEKPSRKNPYGFIPAVTLIPMPSKRFHADKIGQSLVRDVLPMQKLVLNLISLILDFHEQVNYGMRVWKKGDDSEIDEADIEAGGNKNGVIIGPNDDFNIVTPDPKGVDAMRCFLNDTIDNIYRTSLLPSDSNFNKTHQSGASIRGNHAQLYNSLTRMAKYLERGSRQMIELALKVQGIPEDCGVTVQWSTNFSFDSAINAIEEWTQLRAVAQDISPTMVSEFGKKVITPHLYNSPKIDQIEADLDKWKGPPVALAGTAQALPTLQQQNVAVSASEKISDSDEG